jgi:hypothetical protein
MMRRKFEIVNGSTNEAVQPVKCELQISEGGNRMHLLIDGNPILIIFPDGKMYIDTRNSTLAEGYSYSYNIDHLKKEDD